MRKAFSLIELLIVVSIIGVLAVALVPNVMNAPAKARDTARKAAVKDAVAAIEAYQIDNGSLPTRGCINVSASGYYTKSSVPSTTEYDSISATNPIKCTAPEGGIYPFYEKLSNGYVIIVPVELKANANTKYVLAAAGKTFSTTSFTSSRINESNPDAFTQALPYAYAYVR